MENTANKVIVATVKVYTPGKIGLESKIGKLNKRAAKHGMDVLTMRVVSVEQKVRVKDGLEEDYFTIDIEGCEPCIDGWRLVAKVEFSDVVGNVVRIAPWVCDDGSFRTYRTIGPICDHCRSNRNRKDIFVLQDSNGYRKVVGRTCLADFIRNGDAEDLARFAEYSDIVGEWSDADYDTEFDNIGGRAGTVMPLVRYLPIAAMMSRKFGWVSRSAARDGDGGASTADNAAYYIFGRGGAYERWINENDITVDPADIENAEKAIEWACNLPAAETDRSEYLYTLQSIARAGLVDMRKHDGYAASMLAAYHRSETKREEREEKTKSAKAKVFVGTEKKREKGIRVTCKALNSFEGQYGVTTLVRFEHYVGDNEVAVLTWFASGDKYNDWDIDAEYTIDFTCKGHDDSDKYGKQTKINRVKDVS